MFIARKYEAWPPALRSRLHGLFATKKEERIYDYVDIQVKMLEKMYQKRLNGYASIGYKAKGETSMDAPLDIIFNNAATPANLDRPGYSRYCCDPAQGSMMRLESTNITQELIKRIDPDGRGGRI